MGPVALSWGSPASPGCHISGPSDNTALETSTECCHLLALGHSEGAYGLTWTKQGADL